ncbi:MAG TPA: hypothetical protein VMY35_05990 [Phycisphaerae bacterium]|nr:hypothetical protein [Phycisphaerae bacterium]
MNWRKRRDRMDRLVFTRDMLAGRLRRLDSEIGRARRDVMRTALELSRADGAEVESRLGAWPDEEAAR